MEPYHTHPALKKNRPGFLLLMLLICIAIGAFIYYIQLSAFLNPKPPPKHSDSNALPWEEDFLITNDTLQAYGFQAETMPSPEQPSLTTGKKGIIFRAKVHRDRYLRGEMEFRIRFNGRIKGSWTADFTTTSPPIHYTPLGGTPINFTGNVAPSKIYKDEYGKDPSKLYMIAKGICVLEQHNLENDRVRTFTGYIYVTGWLDTDYNAFGKLTITPPESSPKSFQVLHWEGARAE